MANQIKLKNGSGSDPSASDLVVGEVALRTDNASLFTKKDDGTIAEIGAAAGVSDGDKGDITVSNSGSTFTIDDDAITTTKIADVQVTTSKLVLNAVVTNRITDGAVTTAKIADSAITNAKLNNNSITTAKINNSQITTAKIADDAVTLAKIAADAVGTTQIVDDAITAAKIADNAVGSAAIANDSITANELANNSVGNSHIIDATITNTEINGSAAIAGTKISPNFGSQNISTTGNITSGSNSSIFAENNLRFKSTGDAFIDHNTTGQDINFRVSNSSSLDTTPLVVNASGISVTGDINCTSDLILDSTNTDYPRITLHSNATGIRKYAIFNGQAWNPDALLIYDLDGDNTRLTIEPNGLGINRGANSISHGLDVGGTAIIRGHTQIQGNLTISGVVDGVDIAARDTLFGGLTSSSGVLTNGVTATTQSAGDNSTKVATTAYTDTAISNLIDSSPGTLNTLNELAAALGDDASFSTTVTNSIATKLPLSGGTITGSLTVQGDVTLGDTLASDEVSFNSKVNTNLLPSTDGNKNLGSSGNRWGQVHAATFHGSGANLTNVNATTLDSVDSSSFLRSDANDTCTGQINFTGQIISKQDGNRSTQGGNALILTHNTTPALRANHFIHDDFPSGSGTYYIQVTESGVSNDRNMCLQGYGGKVGIGMISAPTEVLHVTGNIACSGTVDGRDLQTDGTKLDGIASGATNVTNNNQLTNGAGYITQSFPSGTRMLFQQTSAPTGWTKDTSGTNQRALRVVSGTVGSGGSVDFTTAFASKGVSGTLGNTTQGGTVANGGNNSNSTTITNISIASATQGGSIGNGGNNTNSGGNNTNSTTVGGSVNNHTLSTSQMPSHKHTVKTTNSDSNSSGSQGYPANDNHSCPRTTDRSRNRNINTNTMDNTGSTSSHSHGFSGSSHSHSINSHTHSINAHSHSFSGSSHSHTYSGSSHSHSIDSHGHSFTGSAHNHSFSGTAINLAVRYLDVIIASKD